MHSGSLPMFRYSRLGCLRLGASKRQQVGIGTCSFPSKSFAFSTSAYNPLSLEAKWQDQWKTKENASSFEKRKEKKFYCLAMFPYPSGKLHMGHVRVYTISDALSRYYRMQGYEVLHPMGWDAFGLPAENAAIERGVAPKDWTCQNIDFMRSQLDMLGFNFDWDRQVTTCSSEYYQWTQWLFVRLFKNGLAYQKEALVNWDPIDQTVLANEQVDGEGRSWRSGAKVEKRALKQWFFRTTQYSKRLLDGLTSLDKWPPSVKTMQKQWLGQSKGASVYFSLEENDQVLSANEQDLIHEIEAFTTRPDTLFGVSFIALAYHHPVLVESSSSSSSSLSSSSFFNSLSLETQALVRHHQEKSMSSTCQETEQETVEGFPLGVNAIHPLTGEKVPIFAANYVLHDYGPGAVMGVPAHDDRDLQFALQHDLRITNVLSSVSDGQNEPVLINSQSFDGQTASEARSSIVRALKALDKGDHSTCFNLRDWLVSRQRYWGTPIPIIHCPSCGELPVPENQLPVLLPEGFDMTGLKGNPLQSDHPIAKEWRSTTCHQCGNQHATRETDTLDTFVDSSWYYLRYASPDSQLQTSSSSSSVMDITNGQIDQIKKMCPVDVYIGGIEHALLHLLYARFISYFLYDQNIMPAEEPFSCLLTQGMVHGLVYRERGSQRLIDDPSLIMKRTSATESATSNDRSNNQHSNDSNSASQFYIVKDGQEIDVDVFSEKMSKSKGNGVAPEDVLNIYGADTTRLFILFKAPPDKILDWDTDHVKGPSRWLHRIYSLIQSFAETYQPSITPPSSITEVSDLTAPEVQLLNKTNKLIEGVTSYFENRHLNVGIALLMKFSNELAAFHDEHLSSSSSSFSPSTQTVYHHALSTMVQLLAPMAPHLCSELWQFLYPSTSADVHRQQWPRVVELQAPGNIEVIEDATLVIQVNGKKKGILTIASNQLTDKRALEKIAADSDVGIKFGLSSQSQQIKQIKKCVVVPQPKKNLAMVNFVI